MSPRQFRTRLVRLGYLTQEQMAQALGVSRPLVSAILAGKRSVTRRVARALELVEQARPVVLCAPMRRALAQARRIGDVVPYPTGREAHIRRVDWDAIYDAMHAMGVIHYPDGWPRITARGWQALHGGRNAKDAGE